MKVMDKLDRLEEWRGPSGNEGWKFVNGKHASKQKPRWHHCAYRERPAPTPFTESSSTALFMVAWWHGGMAHVGFSPRGHDPPGRMKRNRNGKGMLHAIYLSIFRLMSMNNLSLSRRLERGQQYFLDMQSQFAISILFSSSD